MLRSVTELSEGFRQLQVCTDKRKLHLLSSRHLELLFKYKRQDGVPLRQSELMDKLSDTAAMFSSQRVEIKSWRETTEEQLSSAGIK